MRRSKKTIGDRPQLYESVGGEWRVPVNRGLSPIVREIPLSLRDACMDAGGRATQEAKAERARERG